MRTHLTQQSTPMVFLTAMFDETMRLLVDAQDYFSSYGPRDQANATPVERMVYSSEMSRITIRLSSVMAWLLSRRAECAGEITRQEAAERFRLAFGDVCLKEMPEMHHVLPEPVCSLLERSLELYRRAARLDDLLVEETRATLH